jgi:hypothetical protein
MRLNIGWQNLLDTGDRVKNKFAAEMAPAFTTLVGILQRAVDWFAQFVGWLDRGSAGATVVKWAIAGLAVGLVVLAGAMTIIATGLGLFTSALIAFQLAAAVPLGTILAIAAAAGVAADAISILLGNYKKLTAEQERQRTDLRNAGGLPERPTIIHTRNAWENFGQQAALPAAQAGGGVTIGSIAVHLPGGFTGDPLDTGRAIASELRKQLDLATWAKPATAR